MFCRAFILCEVGKMTNIEARQGSTDFAWYRCSTVMLKNERKKKKTVVTYNRIPI